MHYEDNKAPVTQNEADAFEPIEPAVKENLKTYVQSNVKHYGKGPEGWFSTTLTARKEMYGGAAVGMMQNYIDNSKVEEDSDEEPKT